MRRQRRAPPGHRSSRSPSGQPGRTARKRRAPDRPLPQTAPPPGHRLFLAPRHPGRRPPHAPRRHRRKILRAPRSRRGPPDPHQRRTAPERFPPLGMRLCRDVLHPANVAQVRPRRPQRRRRRIPPPRPPLRRSSLPQPRPPHRLISPSPLLAVTVCSPFSEPRPQGAQHPPPQPPRGPDVIIKNAPLQAQMKLAIAIPALNEEDNIESIIQRSLASRDYITTHSPVTCVEITVVSDGSTDQTVPRASKYTEQIQLIVFPVNRGYGAAIKEAWLASDADLLGFLDADGTCDPNFFAPLCAKLLDNGSDVVLGCRLNQDSEMPRIRRLGNSIFALLLSAVAKSRVRDTASGMRVVRRSSLDRLFPLPDGLHFTPAMSARAMLSDAIQITEVDMPYKERVGESKLRVLKDGLRFLRVILEAAFLYRPSRPLSLLGFLFTFIVVVLMLPPAIYYLQNRHVLEWMIYRFLVSNLLGTMACLCFCASYLTSQMSVIALSGEISDTRRAMTQRFFQSRWFWAVPAILFLVGGSLVIGSFLELLATGATYEHWSRYVAMTFCFSTAILLLVTR